MASTTSAATAPELAPIVAGDFYQGQASLRGDIQPHGAAATYSIAYRKHGDSISLRTPDRNVPASDAHSDVVEHIEGLSCETVYDVQGIAVIAGQSTVGPTTSFTSAPCAPRAVAMTILDLSASAIKVSYQVDNRNSSSGIYGSVSYNGIGVDQYFSIVVPPSSTTRTVEREFVGLECGTLYLISSTAATIGGTAAYPGLSFTTSPCSLNRPGLRTLTLGDPTPGQSITLSATASGGVAPYTYSWDVDEDGVVDRRGSSPTLTLSVNQRLVARPKVFVADATGAESRASFLIPFEQPSVSAFRVGNQVELCGDGDEFIEPGERWRIPVTFTNEGRVATANAFAVVVEHGLFANTDEFHALPGHVIVETPLFSLGNLGFGESVSRQLDIQLSADATCGRIYELSAHAIADDHGNVTGANERTIAGYFSTPPAANCQIARQCLASAAAKSTVAPREGFYFNPNRPGNGVSISVIPTASGNVLSALYYTADRSRLPTWYALQAPINGTTVVAPAYRFQQAKGGSSFAVNRESAGHGTISFIDREHLVFEWSGPDGDTVEKLEHYIGGASPFPNRTGAWYNIPEAGSGLMVHSYVQPGTSTQKLFAMHFIYDSEGQPRWTFLDDTPGNAAAGTQAQTFTSVHCPGCPYLPDWSNFLRPAGTAKLSFTDASNGSYSTSINLPAPLAGSWIRTDLPLTILTKPQ